MTGIERPATGDTPPTILGADTPAVAPLADQALIEQATGILAEHLHLSVTDAATALTEHARRQRRAVVVLARSVVDGTTNVAQFRHSGARLGGIRQVLAAACKQAGLDPHGAELVRWVGNAVFRLTHHPVVVKIVLTPALAHRADTAVAAAHLLATHDIPAVRLWPGIGQPVRVDSSSAVTLWRHETHTGTEPTATDLARLLTRLHRVPTTDTGLPTWDPIPDLRHRIADAEHTNRDELAYLLDCCDQLGTQLSTLDYLLPAGIVHGDAHLGNIIPTRHGPIWCDLDSISIGPTEWDLIPLAVAHLRFPHPVNHHRQLARTYGFDVTTWPGFPVLRRLRELKLVTSALPIAASNPTIRAQLHHRLHTFRTGDPTPWTRYP